MSHTYGNPFDESLLSGYLVGELTQADQQRVRLHLEDDGEARELVAEMRRIRDAARTTELAVPGDEEWSETPRTTGSRWFRRSGWVLLIGWGIVLAGLVLWGIVVGPDAWWQKVLAFAVVGGPVLLFLSVLLDRLKVMKHDRYRSVEK